MLYDSTYMNGSSLSSQTHKDRKYNDGWNTNEDLKRYQEEMIIDSENGILKQIIQEPDDYEQLLPVFTIKDGKLVETFCEEYGYPNLTIEGELMYENTFFKNKIDAIKYGINECNGWIEMLEERKRETQKELDRFTSKSEHFENCLSILNANLEEQL